MVITNGIVEFERSVTPAQYEKKAAKVTFHFTVDEGEDAGAATARAGDAAHAEVFRMLRKSEIPAMGMHIGQARVVQVPDHIGVKTPPAPATAQEVAEENPTIPEPATTTEPSQTPIVITDAELTTACQRTTARMNGPEATKAVIAQFVEQPGMPVRTIPQEKRAAFVAALDALKRSEAGDY